MTTLFLEGTKFERGELSNSAPRRPVPPLGDHPLVKHYGLPLAKRCPSELKDMLAKNEAIVIDVRNEETYKVAHIRGAKLIPESEVVKRSDELPRSKLIVTYCS